MQLDESHRTLLENLSTFRRAEQCLNETDAYLLEVLTELADELRSRHAPSVTVGFKEGCLQLDAFPLWRGTGFHFVSIGLENIKVRNVLASADDKPCTGFVWSAYLPEQPRPVPPDEAWLRNCRFPEGFVASKRRGYLAEKSLGRLSVDQLMLRDEVRRYFRAPLNQLSDWLDENWAAVKSLGGNKADGMPATL